jgi:hypothetical protein
MVLVLLIFFSDVLYMKNIYHAGSVEKFWCVVQAPLLADFFKILLERGICIKHIYDNFCTVMVCYVEPRTNVKSVVWYFS